MLRQTEMINMSDQFAIILEDVDQGKVTEDSIHFVARKNAYDACTNKIKILHPRIKRTNQDIEALHMEVENVFETLKKNSEQYDDEEFDYESDYESPKYPLKEEELNGHEGV